jgi:hypothetical protein
LYLSCIASLCVWVTLAFPIPHAPRNGPSSSLARQRWRLSKIEVRESARTY